MIRSTLLAACALLATASCSGGNRNALREISVGQCAPHWAASHDPAPCLSVAEGTAVLHDITGGAHYLLIPTVVLPGIESAAVLAPDAPNYYESAWQARGALARDAGGPVPDEAVALAVNSALARTQDQLHIHVSCQQPAIHAALAAMADRIGPTWTPIMLSTGPYQAMRVMGDSLGARNPFRLLADGLPGAAGDMGRYSLMVAAMRFREGPGFILLAGRGVPGSAMLLDPTCTLAK